MKGLLIIASVLSLQFLPVVAQAVTLQPVAPLTSTVTTTAQTCTTGYCVPDPFTSSGTNSSSSAESYGKGTVNLSKAPSITSYAEANLATGALGGTDFASLGQVRTNLHYTFRINGAPDAVVPVNVKAAASVSVTGGTYTSGSNGQAYARLIVDGSGVRINQETVATYGSGSTGGIATGGFDIDQEYLFRSNTDYDVIMDANAFGYILYNPVLTSIGGITATATVDPYLQIAAGYSGFSLVFSDGVRNSLTDAVATTPIPATALLFGTGLLGLGGLGFARQSRKSGGAQPAFA